MNDADAYREPFPDLDAAGAVRAAFGVSLDDPGRPRVAHKEPQTYELEGEIARGGMGVVVKAFDRSLTRDVALKVLRDELAHESRFVRRFLEEARVTARLDHPGIVPVHDVGRDASDRPYFAMRLVRGRDLVRIIELAHAHREGWNQTRALSVLLKVCEAMAYAHERGVIHRDLKPSNVMVGEFGEVYVMDWGLARALGHDDAHDLRLRDGLDADSDSVALATLERDDSPIVTMDGEVLGTPCYMSLEQAEGRIADLGPRSDVYSVGAMLYHLLAGEPPYVPAGTRVAGRAVLAHLVHGPPRPLSEQRDDLPGELIAICGRAMARDAAERYADMSEMAEDLRAFLERRVVRAYETGAWAEARKWVRRNKALSGALAAFVMALAVGLVVALRLEAKADANSVRAEHSATTATAERDKAEEIAAFLEETLRGVSPFVAAGRDTALLREMMDAAWSRIERGELAASPAAELRLTVAIGSTYCDVVEYDKAEPILRRALSAAESSPATDPAMLARASDVLGKLMRLRGDLDRAESLARRALGIRKRLFAGDHVDVAQSLENVAAIVGPRGKLEESEDLLREALAMHERMFPGDSREVAHNLHNLGVVSNERGDFAGARALHERALDMEERLYPGDHVEKAACLDDLGVACRELGELDRAEALERRALEMRRRVLPNDHPEIAASLNNLAAVLKLRGDLANAEALLREVLAMHRRLYPSDHPQLALSIHNLGATLHQRGDLAGAEPLYVEALAMQRRLFPGDHPGTPAQLHDVAQLQRERGDLAGAESLLREALAMERRLVHGDHADVAECEHALALVLQDQGELADAEVHCGEALEMRRRIFRGNHPDVARSLALLARILEMRGDLAGSEPLFRDALRMNRSLEVPTSRTARAALGLGRVLAAEKRFAAAEEALLDASRMLEGRAEDRAAFAECSGWIVRNYAAWEEADPGRGHGDRASEWQRKLGESEPR